MRPIILFMATLTELNLNPGGVHFLMNNTLAGSREFRCWISSQFEQDMMVVSANFRNESGRDVVVSYLMISHRSATSGNSATSQDGRVEVKGRAEVVLSTLDINVTPHESYFFELSTFLNGRLVCQDSLEYNGK